MALGRVAIVGAGSIGLYYGTKLALAGEDVRFLMRGGFDEASREGIHVISDQEPLLHLARPRLSRDAASLGPCDLVLISLKATANSALRDILPPLLRPGTAVLTLQNGLGNEEFLADIVGPERVLGALCFICLTRDSLATVRHVGKGKLSIGEFGRPPADRTHSVVEAFQSAGVPASLVERLAEERWRKLVWNIPFNGLAVALEGRTVDQILADPVALDETRALMLETISIARALGHPIEESYADFQIERSRPMGQYRPSTLVDWQAGHRLEIEAIWGEPLRRAREAGLSTPRLAALHERLLALDAHR